METIVKILDMFSQMQIPTILVLAGIVFLLLSFVRIRGGLEPPKNPKQLKQLKVTGGTLLVIGLLLSVLLALLPPEPSDMSVATTTNIPVATAMSTHTPTAMPTPTSTPTVTATTILIYTATPTPFPVIESPTATPTVVLQPAPCSPEVNITFPRMDEKLDGDGTVEIKGTASGPDFDYYKVEWGRGEGAPSEVHSISPVHHTPVIKGILDTWNTGALPEGAYKLRLTVVKKDGNFLPPCEVRILIER